MGLLPTKQIYLFHRVIFPRYLEEAANGLPRRPASPSNSEPSKLYDTAPSRLPRPREQSPRRNRSYSPGEISEGPRRSPSPYSRSRSPPPSREEKLSSYDSRKVAQEIAVPMINGGDDLTPPRPKPNGISPVSPEISLIRRLDPPKPRPISPPLPQKEQSRSPPRPEKRSSPISVNIPPLPQRAESPDLPSPTSTPEGSPIFRTQINLRDTPPMAIRTVQEVAVGKSTSPQKVADSIEATIEDQSQSVGSVEVLALEVVHLQKEDEPSDLLITDSRELLIAPSLGPPFELMTTSPTKIEVSPESFDMEVSTVSRRNSILSSHRMEVDVEEIIPARTSSPHLRSPLARSVSPPISPPPNFSSILDGMIAANEEDLGYANQLMEVNRSKSEKERNGPVGVIRDLTNQLEFFTQSLETHELLRPFLLESFTDRDVRRTEKMGELRGDYKLFNEDWRAHCRRLDKIKNRIHRRQRPSTVPATPAVHTSGLASYPEAVTPGPSIVGGRANRRNTNTAFGYGDAVRSEAEFLEILASLETADLRDPNVRATRTAAIVPDMVVDDSERRDLLALEDNRRLVVDPNEFYSLRAPLDLWTEDEVQIFCKRFTQHPKQFGRISADLPEKTTAQCVLFYYRMKNTIDFRSLSDRRGRDGRRRKNRRRTEVEGLGKKGGSLLSNLKRVRADDRDEEEESPPPESPYHHNRNSRYIAESPSVFQPPESTSRPAAIPPFEDFQSTPNPMKKARALKPPETQGLITPADAIPLAEVTSESADGLGSGAGAGAGGLDTTGDPADVKAAARRKASTSSYWSVAERNEFVRLLGLHGKEWNRLAKGLVNKTAVQCRNVSRFASLISWWFVADGYLFGLQWYQNRKYNRVQVDVDHY